MTSCGTINKTKIEKIKFQDSMGKTNFFLAAIPLAFGQF
jgi:hypothetical protein